MEMPMPLEILLWISLGLCTVTLLVSFRVIRRFKKIAKLSNLVYDQLAIAKDGETKDSFDAILDKQLAQDKSQAGEQAPYTNLDNTTDNSHTKVLTKAEAHLIKILQAKYKMNEENSPPTGNNK